MKIEFVRAVVVEGKQFTPGAVVEVGGETASYFESCVRMGHARKLEEEHAKPSASQGQGKK
ncbi:MAG: hypothetical protein EKK55_03620 [Rhodocyclaceae bacterium]|nr:MAG: hypothetical protein EKK55_03620 [Rhodocyclaceae bacterium]